MEADHTLSAIFGEVRALLDTPSKANWRALVELLDTLRDEASAEQLFPYVIDRLDDEWPAHLRQAPDSWLSCRNEDRSRRELLDRIWSFGILFDEQLLDLDRAPHQAPEPPFSALAWEEFDMYASAYGEPAMASSYDGTRIFAAGHAEGNHNDGFIYVHDFTSCQQETLLESALLLPHPCEVNVMCASGDGSRLAALWHNWNPGSMVLQLLDTTRLERPVLWEAALRSGEPKHAGEALYALDRAGLTELNSRYGGDFDELEDEELAPRHDFLITLSHDGSQVAVRLPGEEVLWVADTAPGGALHEIPLPDEISLNYLSFLTKNLLVLHDEQGTLHLLDTQSGAVRLSQEHGLGAGTRAFCSQEALQIWVVGREMARCFEPHGDSVNGFSLTQVSQSAIPPSVQDALGKRLPDPERALFIGSPEAHVLRLLWLDEEQTLLYTLDLPTTIVRELSFAHDEQALLIDDEFPAAFCLSGDGRELLCLGRGVMRIRPEAFSRSAM